ncbi:MAG: hypothetical protein WC378_15520 [Opitutaceae bacterium]|jgi:hypothetical protein
MKVARILKKIITGTSHIESWSRLVTEANASVSEASEIVNSLSEPAIATNAAVTAFLAKPSERTLNAIIDAKLRESVSCEIAQLLREILEGTVSERIQSQRSLLELAIGETRKALQVAREEVQFKTQALGVELGVAVNGEAGFQEIDSKLTSLSRADEMMNLGDAFQSSRGFLRQALGTTDPI